MKCMRAIGFRKHRYRGKDTGMRALNKMWTFLDVPDGMHAVGMILNTLCFRSSGHIGDRNRVSSRSQISLAIQIVI